MLWNYCRLLDVASFYIFLKHVFVLSESHHMVNLTQKRLHRAQHWMIRPHQWKNAWFDSFLMGWIQLAFTGTTFINHGEPASSIHQLASTVIVHSIRSAHLCPLGLRCGLNGHIPCSDPTQDHAPLQLLLPCPVGFDQRWLLWSLLGPDSPTSPIKDLTTHTRAMKLKHKSLEDRLELCLLELKKLCIREAVSTAGVRWGVRV